VEFVVRAIREVGWAGFSVDTARTPLTNMGQTLLEPPDVAGWELGRGWFSTRGHDRAVYARVLDGWLGADSVSILGGNFRTGVPAII